MLRGYITYQELVNNYTIPESSVKNGCSFYRNKKSYSWRNIKIKNCVWVDLESIPKSTRVKYNVPTADEYEFLKWKKEEELKKVAKEQEANLNFKQIKEAVDN